MPNDVYNKLLGLTGGSRPPSARELLGLEQGELDVEMIDAAAARRMDQLDKFALSNDRTTREQAQRLMNEIAKARVELTRQAEKQSAKAKQAGRRNKPQAPSKPKAPAKAQRRPVRPDRPELPEPTQAALPRASRRRKKKAKAKRSKLSQEGWTILAVAWFASVLLTAVVTYMLASPGPADPPDPVFADRQQDPDLKPAPAPEQPEPGPKPEPEPKPESELEPKPEPQPKPEPSLVTSSLDEVMQIQDQQQRLQAFLQLRDSYKPYSKEQNELIRQAVNAFNGTEGIKVEIQAVTNGTHSIGIRGNGFTYPDRPHPTDAVTNLSVLSGLEVGWLDLKGLKKINDFEFLRTMRVKKLDLIGCRSFSDVAVINDIRGLEKVNISYTGVADLSPLRIDDRLQYFDATGCRQIRSLDGLQGMTAEVISLGGCSSLTDLSALREVRGVVRLDLSRTNVTDLTPISHLTLQFLDLRHCKQLTSLKGLEAMTSLERYLFDNTGVSRSEADRIERALHSEPPIVAKNLDEVMQIQDKNKRLQAFLALRDSYDTYSADYRRVILEGLAKINGTDQFQNRIARMTDGTELIELNGNWISNDPHPSDAITDLSVLTGMQADSIRIRGFKGVKNYGFFSTMRSKRLSLTRCPGFSDIGVVNGLEGLERLDLELVPVADLRPLKIDRLNWLTLSLCWELESLDGLQGMHIEKLHVSKSTSLKDIAALAEVKGLKQLSISEAAITDLTPLHGLELTFLRINDCDQLRSLKGLEEMTTLKTLEVKNSQHISEQEVQRILDAHKRLAEGPDPEPTAITFQTDDEQLQAVFAIKGRDDRLNAFIKYRDSLSGNYDAQGKVISEALMAFNGIEHVDLRFGKSGGNRYMWLNPVQPKGEKREGLQITDLSVFTGMRLMVLQLGRLERVQDFSVLKSIDVQKLYINGCTQFSDVSLLEGMDRLDELNLSGTAITDLTPLREKKLKSLRIENCNQLRSLKGLEQMDSLETLRVNGSQHITDEEVRRVRNAQNGTAEEEDSEPGGLDFKTDNKRLQAIFEIEDKDDRLNAFITYRDSLGRNFDAQVNVIREALMAFNGIEEVEMQHGTTDQGGRYIWVRPDDPNDRDHANLGITDISVFKGMKLRSLQISRCENLADFSVLRTIEVGSLSLYGCTQFTDLSLLDGMDKISSLNIGKTGIKNLKGLKPRALNTLTLNECAQLESLDGIERMSMGNLSMNNTRALADISALREARVSRSIIFSSTPIEDLSAISHLRITSLTLNYLPKIKSLEPIKEMHSLRSLGFQSHRDNPLSEQIQWLKEQRPGISVR